MSDLIMDELAQKVYDILVEECNANADSLNSWRFCHHLAEYLTKKPLGGFEWNFDQGIGMKLYCDSSGIMNVRCYPECQTPERLAMMQRATDRLAALASICDLPS